MTMSLNEKIDVFLFEDDPMDVDLIKLYLLRQKNILFDVDVAARLSTGIEQLALKRYDIILSDLGLPDSSGLDTFMKVHAALPDIPIIVLTGLDDEEIALRAVNQGAQDYLSKEKSALNCCLKRSVMPSKDKKYALS